MGTLRLSRCVAGLCCKAVEWIFDAASGVSKQCLILAPNPWCHLLRVTGSRGSGHRPPSPAVAEHPSRSGLSARQRAETRPAHDSYNVRYLAKGDIVDVGMFVNSPTGRLVEITGTDPVHGPWMHRAFVPHPLPDQMPPLEGTTFLAVANARAAIAVLDSTARQLPNPGLLRTPTLRREAQATSALEGTYAPLSDVLTADESSPSSAELREVLNYVEAAHTGFEWWAQGRGISGSLLSELQGRLMSGTRMAPTAGQLRETQVVIGRRDDAPPGSLLVEAARFVPPPPGDVLRSGVDVLVKWMRQDHSDRVDPIVAAAMGHYQFESLHPFTDGNGRIGRLLIILHLLQLGVLSEPTLTVSPWFEAHRQEYYDVLLAVSARGDWDRYIAFFAQGIEGAARFTRAQMLDLVTVQESLKETIRSTALRADTAHAVVDFAVANPSFTVRSVERAVGISYGRANTVVGQLVDLSILAPLDESAYNRRFYAPRVLEVLLRPR